MTIQRCDAPGCEWSAMYRVTPDPSIACGRVFYLCEDHAAPWLNLPTTRGVA